MKKSNFMIFSPTGEKPKITLASIVPENGAACCIVEGYTDDVLTCLSAIVSTLTHQANVPNDLIIHAVVEGMVKDLKSAEGDEE